jgi:hypothetical protein
MTVYFVWRRNDGYVAATTYPPAGFVGGDGTVTTFEHLGRFDNWGDAYACILNAGGAARLPRQP